jgi:hypothetical protein
MGSVHWAKASAQKMQSTNGTMERMIIPGFMITTFCSLIEKVLILRLPDDYPLSNCI